MASTAPPPPLHRIKSPLITHNWSHPTSRRRYFPHYEMPRLCAVKIASEVAGCTKGGTDHGAYGPDLLRKPVASLPDDKVGDERSGPGWIDWEDRMLSDTVPLVGLVRMILHSGRYKSGDRLRPDHEKIIVERLLPYHPNYEKKIGSGIDHIMTGYHPEFERTKCLLIVNKDGVVMDFSYRKCIKGLIRKKYPLHAESFIVRHFRRHWRRE